MSNFKTITTADIIKNDFHQFNYRDFPNDTTTLTRVNFQTEVVEVNKRELLSEPLYTRESVFFFTLWCYCFIDMQKKIKLDLIDIFNVDWKTLDFYKKTGKSMKLFLVGLVAQMKKADTPINAERYKIFKNEDSRP